MARSQPLCDAAYDDEERTAKLAADVWNVIGHETAVDGLEGPYDVEDVNVTRCHNPRKHGHILGRPQGIKLGINYSWWSEQRNERLLVFLAHEYAHLTDVTNVRNSGGHMPAFWEEHIDHVHEVMMGVDQIEGVEAIDPHRLSADLHASVNSSIVDKRSMTVEECRMMIEGRFEYLL
jgi:hypothetical protein